MAESICTISPGIRARPGTWPASARSRVANRIWRSKCRPGSTTRIDVRPNRSSLLSRLVGEAVQTASRTQVEVVADNGRRGVRHLVEIVHAQNLPIGSGLDDRRLALLA